METPERKPHKGIITAVVAVLLLTCVSAASAQTRARKVTTTAKKVKQPQFVREKFDPKRDPFKDLKRAVTIAVSSNRRIILDVGGEWCSWCVYMDKFFFEHRELGRLRERNYVWVKVNWSEENENTAFLSQFPEILAFPHLFVLDAEGKLLHSQDTAVFEDGERYDPDKIREFLATWAPGEHTSSAAAKILLRR